MGTRNSRVMSRQRSRAWRNSWVVLGGRSCSLAEWWEGRTRSIWNRSWGNHLKATFLHPSSRLWQWRVWGSSRHPRRKLSSMRRSCMKRSRSAEVLNRASSKCCDYPVGLNHSRLQRWGKEATSSSSSSESWTSKAKSRSMASSRRNSRKANNWKTSLLMWQPSSSNSWGWTAMASIRR